MRLKSYRRLVRRLGLAIAVAAFAAPAAQAKPVITAVGGTDATPQVLYADDLHAMLPREGGTNVAPQVLYPDDLHATLPRASGLELSFADGVRRQVSSQPGSNGPTDSLGRPLPPSNGPTDSLGRPVDPPQPVIAAASSGFDWSDAGIGAASAFGLMLLGVGVLFAGRHSRKGRLATI